MEPDAARRVARERARRRRGLRRITRRGWTLFALALVAVVVHLTLGRSYDGALAPGTRIGGIDVGGRTAPQAEQALGRLVRSEVRRTLTLRSGSHTLPLRLDGLLALDAVRRAAARSSEEPEWRRIARRLSLGPRLTLSTTYAVDRLRLHAALAAARDVLEIPATPAGVLVTASGTFRASTGRGGIAIDESALARLIADPVRINGPVNLELHATDPLTSSAAARAAIRAATALLAVPHAVVVAGHPYPLRASALRAALTFVGDDGSVRMALARAPIRAELARLFGAAEADPQGARFVLGADGGLTIEPSRTGTEVDADALRHALEADPSRREVAVGIRQVEPALTTAKATALGITDLVSEFTTPFLPGYPRVTNIRRAAELLDGHILNAGATFSLNDVLGRRTLDRGFVVAPQIETGKLRDAVGGGVSQVATTLFNAAFFAGLRLDQHTPHEFYISRYPPGREATVSWGGPELVFTNDWSAPLVMLLDVGDASITVRFYSRSLGRRVESGTGERTNETRSRELRVKNKKLKPGTRHVLQEAGSGGFDVSYWRKVYRNDVLIRDETFKAHYKPEDRIVEVGPPRPKVRPPTATTPAASTASSGETTTTPG